MTVAPCSDKWVYIRRIIRFIFCCHASSKSERTAQYCEYIFHGFIVLPFTISECFIFLEVLLFKSFLHTLNVLPLSR